MKFTVLFVTLIIACFTACKKDNTSAYDGFLNGRWELNALSEKFSSDNSWKPVPTTDSSTLTLLPNGTYSFTIGNYHASTGTFTVADSSNTNIKILKLSAQGAQAGQGELYIERLSAREFKMDHNPGFCGTGYMSRRFEKKD